MNSEPQSPPNDPPGDRSPRIAPTVNVAVLAVLVYAFLVAVPLVRGVRPDVGVIGGSLLFAALCLGLVGGGARLVVSPAMEGALALGFLVVWGLVAQSGPDAAWAKLYLGPAANVAFLLSCLFIGKLLSRIVRERAMALPVAIVAGLADIFTVFWGPTGHALEKAPGLVQKLSLAIPAVGSAAGEAGAHGLAYVAAIGLGDFIFLSLFLALAVRFDFSVRRTFIAMVIGAAVGIVVALAPGLGLPGMPLLPYMGAGFIIVNARRFRLSRTEVRDLCIALAVVVGLLGVAATKLPRPQSPEPKAAPKTVTTPETDAGHRPPSGVHPPGTKANQAAGETQPIAREVRSKQSG